MTPRATTPSTLCEAFQTTSAAYPDTIALRTPDDSVRYTWRQYAERVARLAAGLAGLGVERGDTVGLMLTNRPEFHLLDTAAIHLGAVPFSIYNSLTAEQIAYVLGNAGNRVMITDIVYYPEFALVSDEGQLAEYLRYCRSAGITSFRVYCPGDLYGYLAADGFSRFFGLLSEAGCQVDSIGYDDATGMLAVEDAAW